jgi:cell division transport system permease protein
MTETSKSSLRRSKPNYMYSIIGVALVLLIMGVMGWILLNFSRVGNTFKEDIRISAYLRTQNQDTITSIQQFIAAQPYAKDVEYINKESAKKIWNKDNNEDWSKILDYNPLPESIDFYALSEYVNTDSLTKISSSLLSVYGDQITDLQYPRVLVSSLSENTKIFSLAFIIVSVVLCLIVIFSIDNTIRLAMFSNRFLIKTMQMVGATRTFIAKPMDIRAVINGLISAVIAIALLLGLITWLESLVPQLKIIRDMQLNLVLFGGMMLLGMIISVLSTHRSVIKYLKMKLDDLY